MELDQELIQRRSAVLSKLADALKTARHRVELGSAGNIYMIDGFSVGVDVKYEKRGVGCSSYTGKLRMRLEAVLPRYTTKNYPEPKNGFDMKKAVERIEELLQRVKDYEISKRNKIREVDRRLRFKEDVLGEIGATGYPSVDGFEIQAGSSIMVKLTLKVHKDQLKRILLMVDKEKLGEKVVRKLYEGE